MATGQPQSLRSTRGCTSRINRCLGVTGCSPSAPRERGPAHPGPLEALPSKIDLALAPARFLLLARSEASPAAGRVSTEGADAAAVVVFAGR